ncbi:MAG: NAD(P)/FAD-dependent oxidoreductase [Chitinophagaceae bacterium]
MEKRKIILIIGGGFAGINVAKQLINHKGYDIILADRNNYNYFTPLSYQLAGGFLEVNDISYPFRKFIRKYKNINFRQGEFRSVDVLKHTCTFDNGIIHYDLLIFAMGASTNYFGNENIREQAVTVKSLSDALAMRNHLLESLEKASRITERNERKKLLTVVVAGAGPTGVETAGVLAELRKNILAKEYPELEDIEAVIYLVDGTTSVLPQMSERSRREAENALKKLGVQIILGDFIKDYRESTLTFASGNRIETKNLIWATGVTVHPIEGLAAVNTGKAGRILVDEFNRVKGVDNIFAIGDICTMNSDPSFPAGHPQLAQPAIQQGKLLAKNLRRQYAGKSLIPFRYKDKGTLAIVGRNRAVADLFVSRKHIGGFPALLIWLFVHLAGLLTWRNRVKTLCNWIIAWLTRDQALRMIVTPAFSEEIQIIKTPGVPSATTKQVEADLSLQVHE